jgi:hypothetical protein
MRLKTCSLILLAFCTFCLFSCQKENEYPRRFKGDSYVIGEIRGFSKFGEIKYNSVINNFISESKDFFWQEGTASSDDWNIEIEILSESRARMITKSDSPIIFNLARKDGILYFEFPDTAVITNFYSNELGRLSPLYMENILIYPGYSITKFIGCIYASESESEIKFPVMSYMERTYNTNDEILYSRAGRNINNYFNISYLSKISQGSMTDTIVYQENEIIFRELK